MCKKQCLKPTLSYCLKGLEAPPFGMELLDECIGSKATARLGLGSQTETGHESLPSVNKFTKDFQISAKITF
jgi:hypothetical protein